MKKIILTGGGSAGHVTVNLALIPKLKEQGFSISYIGSKNGIEKELLKKVEGVPYHGIRTGKLRRYFDWNNFKDPFKVIGGVFEAYSIIRKEKPAVIFSKGGFVSVPVIIGAYFNHVPAIIHESDLTPGLANQIALKFATRMCVTFRDTLKYVTKEKAQYVGAVVREELKQGNAEKGLSFCNLKKERPILLMMGGSLGSKKINDVLRENLPELLQTFQIVHLCGKENIDHSLQYEGYRQFEYVNEELPDLLAMTDFILSRAGSNAIFEFLELRKPMLLIPLSKEASRGDQILNAQSFQKEGYCDVLLEENLTSKSFMQALQNLQQNKEVYIKNMEQSGSMDSLTALMQIIKQVAK